MDDRTKASVLWAAVGALAFLVLAQGYLLLADHRVPLLALFGVAAIVAIVSGLATYGFDSYLR